ncbi:MAG: tetratricopeptide repeat protein [Gemmatimonadota bacterium]
MNLDKLKESARKFEQGGQWRQAIDVYKRALKDFEEAGEGVPDPSLYNRVGDLEMKDNDASSAIRAYEQAADLYTEQGFFNNAIALCGKILRVNPGRTPTYLRLAQLNARKNFVGEAKKNLLEYIERMDALQHREEALQAVKLFADQFSANPDIRLMLVELLRASSRMEEAREQLGKLATELEARGDATGARRTRERLQSIEAEDYRDDEVRSVPTDLIFIDTGTSGGRGASIADGSEDVIPRIILEPTPEALGIFELPPPIEGFESLEVSPAELPAGENVRDFIINSGPFGELGDGSESAEVDAIELDVVPELDLPDDAVGLELDPIELVGAAVDSDAPFETLEPVALDGEPGGDPAASDLVFLEVEDVEPAGPATVVVEEDATRILRDRGRLLVEIGDRAEGVRTLETALERFAAESRFDEGLEVADELIQIEPEAVFRYQKRVEVAYRSGQRPELIRSYLGLADALLRGGGLEHAITVYRRVLDHDPDNPKARAALAAIIPPESSPARRPPPAPSPPPPPVAAPNNFIDLGALILDEPQTRDTRMRVGEGRPIEDEDEAFHEALEQFKRGIEENIDAEDYDAHYDLGVAFKEMGLLDEAIAQFQKALRSPDGRLKTSEQLGIAFFEKGRFAIAEAVLRRAVENLPGADDEKIGLIYWLARALEAQLRRPEALGFYERALAVDIRFLDIGDRVHHLGSEATG